MIMDLIVQEFAVAMLLRIFVVFVMEMFITYLAAPALQEYSMNVVFAMDQGPYMNAAVQVSRKVDVTAMGEEKTVQANAAGVILLTYVEIAETGLLLTIARMIVVIVRASVEVMQL